MNKMRPADTPLPSLPPPLPQPLPAHTPTHKTYKTKQVTFWLYMSMYNPLSKSHCDNFIKKPLHCQNLIQATEMKLSIQRDAFSNDLPLRFFLPQSMTEV